MSDIDSPNAPQSSVFSRTVLGSEHAYTRIQVVEPEGRGVVVAVEEQRHIADRSVPSRVPAHHLGEAVDVIRVPFE